MSQVIMPSQESAARSYIGDMGHYREMHRRSLEDPEGFWSEQAESLSWSRRWEKVHTWDQEGYLCRWFEGGRLNASHNCLDRHLEEGKGERTAIIWEPDEPGPGETYSYSRLHGEVCRFANVLRKHGIGRGDRVCIYLPMVPELPVAMLACARIGAVHSVVFAGFSSDALRGRILDSGCRALVCGDAVRRGGRIIPLKENVDEALAEPTGVERVFVVGRAGVEVEMALGRDLWWEEEMGAEDIGPHCPPAEMEAEDPLFILYTSGSTGKPKGVLHTTAGYLLHASLTHRWVFGIHDDDVWWCTADIGWVTGHSYIVYGPLANGVTQVMFEGVPTYPQPDRYWKIVEKYGVTALYTAPTVLRSLIREGEEWTRTADLSSLRVLGSVGEPINPEVWLWYHRRIGGGRCPVIDTWWQTETGGVLITSIAGTTPMKPGSAGFPFFGVDAVVLDPEGRECAPGESGTLCLRRPWPGMMRTVYGNHDLFVKNYWSVYPGHYVSGDGCRVDEDGFFWMEGRIDDVINVSGHRIGTAEVESALVGHRYVSEAAVVGVPHEIKGQGIYAFVTLKAEYEDLDGEEVRKELTAHARKEIGPIATPDVIQFAPALPKTRSGKIMRRILRRIAEGSGGEDLGDTSTLADPSVVETLVEGRRLQERRQ
ncbi:MAG: acetate--CoA ligase [Actinomycetota bacterium]|nr:acetate--CoA ligase [Actinomycetota bacterium]